MSTREKWMAGALAALLLFFVVAAVFAIRDREAAAAADGYQRAKAEESDKAAEAMAARNRALEDRLDALEREKREVKTAPQAVRVIERLVPQTVGQATQVTREQLPAETAKALPDSPAYTVRTEKAEVEIARAQLDCKKTVESLAACTKDKEDIATQRETAKATSAEWEKKAKGGSATRRALRVGFFGLCGGGGAVTGSVVGGTKGAGIGALIGVVGCALVSK